MEVADVGRAVVYVDSTPRGTSDWLCREEMIHVRGTITVKPRPPTTSGTARLGCGGAGGGGGVRRVLSFNVNGTRAVRWPASLTLQGLVVEGVIVLVRNAHVAVVEATLIDVALISADNNTDHVTVDVINSTWTSRGPGDLTPCKVRVCPLIDDDVRLRQIICLD